MNFIELTLQVGYKVWVNFDLVTEFGHNRDTETRSWIKHGDNGLRFVKETPEEILTLIALKVSANPTNPDLPPAG